MPEKGVTEEFLITGKFNGFFRVYAGNNDFHNVQKVTEVMLEGIAQDNASFILELLFHLSQSDMLLHSPVVIARISGNLEDRIAILITSQPLETLLRWYGNVPLPAKDVRSQKRKDTDIGKKDLEG